MIPVLTLCRSLTSLWLNLWDEKQRKTVKFDKGKNYKALLANQYAKRAFP
jgi:hypothetical protein